MKTLNIFTNFCTALLSAVFIALLLFDTSAYKQSVTDGLNACGNVLVPSLFPFLFLSTFIVESDGLSVVTKRLGVLCRILRISNEGILALILCLIGGFPVGAKTVSTLYREKKISYEEAKKLSYCCVGAGPGFMITFVGQGIFHSKELGIMLFFSNMAGVLFTFFIQGKSTFESKDNHSPLPRKNLGEALVTSTEGAVKATLSMCGFVVLFIVINNLLSLLPFWNGYFASLLEITSGTINYAKDMRFEFVGALIGFGGICVHFQIFAIIKDIKINKAYFVMMRALQGVFSGITLHILLRIFPIAQETFGNMESPPHPRLYSTLWGAGALIILSIIFLVSINNTKNKQEVNLCAE
ncbi:MAG: hypothetical protein ACI4RI_03010 [Ruminococcus sp.]